MEEQSNADMAVAIRDFLAKELDDPEVELEKQGPERWKIWQNLKAEDSALGSPFLFCLSREPATRSDWEQLRAALPERYDTWTVTEDVDSLNFEIECGIKRWMGLSEITEHRIERKRGWVAYSYDTAPPSDEMGEIAQITRWFRKRREYKDQEEYRLAWKPAESTMGEPSRRTRNRANKERTGFIQTMGAAQALEGFSVQVRLLSSATLALTEPPATP